MDVIRVFSQCIKTVCRYYLILFDPVKLSISTSSACVWWEENRPKNVLPKNLLFDT